MKSSDIPAKFPIPWAFAAGGSYIRPIPEASQIGIEGGAASLNDGFPPLNFQPRGAGGVPPFGEDFNGIMNQITSWNQWSSAGGPTLWDSTFSTDIAGYPQGSIVGSNGIAGLYWRSTADDNTTNPDLSSTANWVQFSRVKLTGAQSFFVATTGSDANGNGTSGSPWATPQKAWNVLQSAYDLNGFVATVQIADGTYAQANGVQCLGALTGCIGGGGIIFNGNSVTPSNVIISPSAGSAISLGDCAAATFQNMRIKTNSGSFASGLVVTGNSILYFGGFVFDSCVSAHLVATQGGRIVARGTNPYTVVGGSAFHWQIGTNSSISYDSSQTVTFTGTPAFTTSVAFCSGNGLLELSSTNSGRLAFSGSATGRRWTVQAGGGINTEGATFDSYLPGSVTGITTTPGWIV